MNYLSAIVWENKCGIVMNWEMKNKECPLLYPSKITPIFSPSERNIPQELNLSMFLSFSLTTTFDFSTPLAKTFKFVIKLYAFNYDINK